LLEERTYLLDVMLVLIKITYWEINFIWEPLGEGCV